MLFPSFSNNRRGRRRDAAAAAIAIPCLEGTQESFASRKASPSSSLLPSLLAPLQRPLYPHPTQCAVRKLHDFWEQNSGIFLLVCLGGVSCILKYVCQKVAQESFVPLIGCLKLSGFRCNRHHSSALMVSTGEEMLPKDRWRERTDLPAKFLFCTFVSSVFSFADIAFCLCKLFRQILRRIRHSRGLLDRLGYWAVAAAVEWGRRRGRWGRRKRLLIMDGGSFRSSPLSQPPLHSPGKPLVRPFLSDSRYCRTMPFPLGLWIRPLARSGIPPYFIGILRTAQRAAKIRTLLYMLFRAFLERGLQVSCFVSLL